MKKIIVWVVIILVTFMLFSCSVTEVQQPIEDEKPYEDNPYEDDGNNTGSPSEQDQQDNKQDDKQDSKQGSDEDKSKEGNYEAIKNRMLRMFGSATPKVWGENIGDVITHVAVDEKIAVLTFDACRGEAGLAYDEALINFLIEEQIPATLFFSGRWIKNNQDIFIELSKNPLFDIANHGYEHKPLSVSGQSAYNIKGTSSVEEAFDEIYKNQILIKELTGQYPKYFRSGTAYYDDVAVKMIYELGLKPINYNVLGDAGATFSKTQIVNSMLSSKNGSILLFHMNHPTKDIAAGVKEGVLKLKEQGFEFRKLSDVDDYLK